MVDILPGKLEHPLFRRNFKAQKLIQAKGEELK